jgi:hypothetical protein
MKTPMQEVYENFNLMSDVDFKAWMLNTDLLEKEKEVMSQVYADGGDWDEVPQPRFKNYYNQTFNTKER